MRKRELKKKRKKVQKVVFIVAKILVVENPGIDPGTSRTRSGRSIISTNSPGAYPVHETDGYNYCHCVDLEIYMIHITVLVNRHLQ